VEGEKEGGGVIYPDEGALSLEGIGDRDEIGFYFLLLFFD
jgi:hypothetical protein